MAPWCSADRLASTTATPPTRASSRATRSEDPIDSTLPPPTPGSDAYDPYGRRRHQFADLASSRILAAVTAGLLVVTILATGNLKMKWDVIAPGDARPLNELIKVETRDSTHPVPTYVPQGRVLYTTVAIEERVSAFEALWAKAHSDYRLVKEEVLTGHLPSKTVQRINQEDMDQSKVAAEVVALRKLGYTVAEHGDGALIVQIDDKAKVASGAKLRVGDAIVAVDGKPVTVRDDVGHVMASHKAGDQVTLRLRHDDGTQADTTVVTHGDPKTGRALIGVNIRTADFGYDLPFDVQIDTGPVGGPSAGLAFTLGLLDLLTPGELTGGKLIAVTGTIEDDGTVGPIGGVGQKAVAARHRGAVAFIVPDAVAPEARKHAGKMKIIPVKTLDDALRALESLGGRPLPATTAR